MAKTTKHIFYGIACSINSVDLVDHIESVEMIVATNDARADSVNEAQEYGMPAKRVVRGIRMNFYQDYAAAKVYATLFAAWEARTTFNIVCRPDSGSKGTTNPEWTIAVYVGEMPLMAGTQGDRHMAPVTLAPAGLLDEATA